ncbi:MAG: glycosyl transferase [Pseudohongiella sp.]|nr:MAG: glycosyl transferase [Pseudohongiella sp.]
MNEEKQISLSVSLVVFDTPTSELSLTLQTLSDALMHATSVIDLKNSFLYLIDNSEEGTYSEFFRVMEKKYGETIGLELISGHGNIGYGSAHNLAIRQSQCDYHIVMNPDVSLDTKTVKIGIEELEQEPSLSLLSPFAEDDSGQKQFLCKRYPSVFIFLARGFLPYNLKKLFRRQLDSFEMKELSEERLTTGIRIVSGCFMFFRLKSVQEINGFDERYFLYFEDFDICERIRSQGTIGYFPLMRITHGGGNSAKKGGKHIRMFIRSGITFFNTHGWKFF